MILLFSSGFDVLAEAGNKTEKYYWFLLLDKPNQAPEIDPKIAIEFNWPTNSIQLDAIVTDDPNDPLVYEWTILSGPGDVIFSNPDAEDITAEFSIYGTYVLQLSVSDGEFTPEPVQVTITFNFLENYTNPQEQKLPENRVYPMGRMMMITPWLAKSDIELQKIKDHGFSMQGPQWDTRSSVNDSVMSKAESLGLRAAYRVVDGAGAVSKLLPKLDDGTEEEKLYNNIRSQLLRAVNNPDYNDQIDIWLTGTEEISTRNSGNVEKLNRYLRNFQKIVQENDPQQRPLWMSDVTGVDASQMNITHQYLDMVGPQMFLERIGNGTHYEHNVIINRLVGEVVKTAETYNIPATVSFGALYEPIPERDTPEFIDRVVEHDLYLALNRGIQGFQIYPWYNYTWDGASDTTTWNNYKTSWYKHVKRFTDYGLNNAYLWGDKRDDLTLKILSGADRNEFYDYPSISMQNIQYVDKRFVILTNSSTGIVHVEVSNFPNNCVKLLDIREEKYVDNSGSINTTLQPLDVRLYRFDPVDTCSIQ